MQFDLSHILQNMGSWWRGILVSIAILIFDVLACYIVASGDHEYANDLRGRSLNLYIVFGTLICDFPLLLCILYIFAYNGKNLFKMCCKCDITCTARECLTHSLLSIVVGKKTLDKITKLSDNDMIALMFSALLITPLLSFASHIGYILLAWLTEPSKCTTILILFYVLVVYFYLSFRKSYKHHARINISCNCLNGASGDKNILNFLKTVSHLNIQRPHSQRARPQETSLLQLRMTS